jgi:hypothetical protein
MLRNILSNGTIVELYSTGWGATAPNIVWIEKVTNHFLILPGKK